MIEAEIVGVATMIADAMTVGVATMTVGVVVAAGAIGVAAAGDIGVVVEEAVI